MKKYIITLMLLMYPLTAISGTSHAVVDLDDSVSMLKTVYTQVVPGPKTLFSNCNITNDWKVNGCSFDVSEGGGDIVMHPIVPIKTIHQDTGCGAATIDRCLQVSETFKRCYADPSNLFPELNVISKYISGKGFGSVTMGGSQMLGLGLGIVESADKTTLEPRSEVKGVIARTYLYMYAKGCIKATSLNGPLFGVWGNDNTSTMSEYLRNFQVLLNTGDHNPFISNLKRMKVIK